MLVVVPQRLCLSDCAAVQQGQLESHSVQIETVPGCRRWWSAAGSPAAAAATATSKQNAECYITAKITRTTRVPIHKRKVCCKNYCRVNNACWTGNNARGRINNVGDSACSTSRAHSTIFNSGPVIFHFYMPSTSNEIEGL